ncbi:MAG: hypothetical protein JWL64_2734 [Frankiales bacterium]|nr:hypothetical protein [Frankiales bacterium]
MSDLLLTLAIVLAAIVVVLVLLVLTAVAPVFVAAQLADRRGFDATRSGLIAGGWALACLLLAVLAVTGRLPGDAPAWTVVVFLGLTWAAPALLSQLGQPSRWVGRPGAHS